MGNKKKVDSLKDYFSKGVEALWNGKYEIMSEWFEKAITYELKRYYYNNHAICDLFKVLYVCDDTNIDVEINRVARNIIEQFTNVIKHKDEDDRKFRTLFVRFHSLWCPIVYDCKCATLAYLFAFLYHENKENDKNNIYLAEIYYQKYIEFTAKEDLDGDVLSVFVKLLYQRCMFNSVHEEVKALMYYGEIALFDFHDYNAAFYMAEAGQKENYLNNDKIINYYILGFKYMFELSKDKKNTIEYQNNISVYGSRFIPLFYDESNFLVLECFLKLFKDELFRKDAIDSCVRDNRITYKLSPKEKQQVEKIYSIDDIKNILSEGDIEKYFMAKRGSAITQGKGIDTCFAELDNLTGLSSIKEEVRKLANFIIVQERRKLEGSKIPPKSKHIVFTGNPGTGKTTVARIIANLYKQIGVLSKGHLVEVSRKDLVAEYIGQTAPKTQEKINEAMGGVLFIDEAYTLYKENNILNDYGPEAVDTLLKALEDNREEFVVIMAGYSKEMNNLIENVNPGLKSRFNTYIDFPDYSVDELIEIFVKMCTQYNYTLSDSAKVTMRERISDLVVNKDKNFANAREIRNLFENVITNHSSRVIDLESGLNEILPEDFSV